MELTVAFRTISNAAERSGHREGLLHCQYGKEEGGAKEEEDKNNI
jgi:hypothetical protein